MSDKILAALGLTGTVSGTYLGNGEWSKTTDAGLLEVINPSTHEVIGRVHSASASDYETIVQRAQAAGCEAGQPENERARGLRHGGESHCRSAARKVVCRFCYAKSAPRVLGRCRRWRS